jgi:hypothetical protein
MFGRKQQEQPDFDLRQFDAELSNLVKRAINSRHIHLKQISQSLEDSAEAVRLRWAIHTPVV